jgi:hypothetical protein
MALSIIELAEGPGHGRAGATSTPQTPRARRARDSSQRQYRVEKSVLDGPWPDYPPGCQHSGLGKCSQMIPDGPRENSTRPASGLDAGLLVSYGLCVDL